MSPPKVASKTKVTTSVDYKNQQKKCNKLQQARIPAYATGDRHHGEGDDVRTNSPYSYVVVEEKATANEQDHETSSNAKASAGGAVLAKKPATRKFYSKPPPLPKSPALRAYVKNPPIMAKKKTDVRQERKMSTPRKKQRLGEPQQRFAAMRNGSTPANSGNEQHLGDLREISRARMVTPIVFGGASPTLVSRAETHATAGSGTSPLMQMFQSGMNQQCVPAIPPCARSPMPMATVFGSTHSAVAGPVVGPTQVVSPMNLNNFRLAPKKSYSTLFGPSEEMGHMHQAEGLQPAQPVSMLMHTAEKDTPETPHKKAAQEVTQKNKPGNNTPSGQSTDSTPPHSTGCVEKGDEETMKTERSVAQRISIQEEDLGEQLKTFLKEIGDGEPEEAPEEAPLPLASALTACYSSWFGRAAQDIVNNGICHPGCDCCLCSTDYQGPKMGVTRSEPTSPAGDALYRKPSSSYCSGDEDPFHSSKKRHSIALDNLNPAAWLAKKTEDVGTTEEKKDDAAPGTTHESFFPPILEDLFLADHQDFPNSIGEECGRLTEGFHGRSADENQVAASGKEEEGRADEEKKSLQEKTVPLLEAPLSPSASTAAAITLGRSSSAGSFHWDLAPLSPIKQKGTASDDKNKDNHSRTKEEDKVAGVDGSDSFLQELEGQSPFASFKEGAMDCSSAEANTTSYRREVTMATDCRSSDDAAAKKPGIEDVKTASKGHCGSDRKSPPDDRMMDMAGTTQLCEDVASAAGITRLVQRCSSGLHCTRTGRILLSGLLCTAKPRPRNPSPSPQDVSSPERPHKVVPIKPAPEDVICGGRGSEGDHPGTAQYRKMVQACPDYFAHSRGERMVIVRKLYWTIRGRCGRFLHKPRCGEWYELDSEGSLRKIQRDLARQFKKNNKGRFVVGSGRGNTPRVTSAEDSATVSTDVKYKEEVLSAEEIQNRVEKLDSLDLESEASALDAVKFLVMPPRHEQLDALWRNLDENFGRIKL